MASNTIEESPKGRPVIIEEFVDKVIKTKKIMPDTKKDPLKMVEKNGNFRATIDLVCTYKVRMGIRQSVDDAFDFSILLIYTDNQNHDYILRRYNGDHGDHTDPITGEKIRGPHIHKITEECQRTIHKDEGHAEITNRYRMLNEAIDVFMADMNICYKDGTRHTKLSEFW